MTYNCPTTWIAKRALAPAELRIPRCVVTGMCVSCLSTSRLGTENEKATSILSSWLSIMHQFHFYFSSVTALTNEPDDLPAIGTYPDPIPSLSDLHTDGTHMSMPVRLR
jgi:hypothetical protein